MSPPIWQSDRPTRSASTWWIPLVLGLLIAVAQIQLVVAAWESCGISAATGLTTTSLYALGVPALTFLNWLLVALPAEVWLAKRTRAGNRWFLTVVTSGGAGRGRDPRARLLRRDTYRAGQHQLPPRQRPGLVARAGPGLGPSYGRT